MLDRVAGRRDDTLAELPGNRGVERPLFERFVGERTDSGQEPRVIRKDQLELHLKVYVMRAR
jgi:hypothetical protein